ncbi:MAG: hypothetical protein HZA78_10970 [Candidatus Schekmanbacteria bacterium]|nr:hypothetical protein [Candidatus Schekmanbacteria bacterium]
MKKKKFAWPALFLALVLALGCSAEPKAEKKELPLEPTGSDDLITLMKKSEMNIRYLIYGIINLDAVKIENSTKNIAQAGQLINVNTSYHFKGNRAEWEEMSQSVQTLSEDLRQAFLDENYTKMNTDFSELIAVCTDCHMLYWDSKMKELRAGGEAEKK